MFLWYSITNAQVITGVVCDKDTKLPVSNVYVFLDGTSINTITNNLGKFELKTAPVINTSLVLQHLSYETTIVDRPYQGLPDTLYIEAKINILDEITVSPDRFTRTQKIRAFREQFLGVSRAGSSCKIINEDDIQLFFNMHTRKLSAFSDKPIVVVNDYLGYKISLILINFEVQYGSNLTLNRNNVQTSILAVVSSFTDMTPNDSRILQHRDNVYEQSSNYFFKSFANDVLQNNNFRIFNNFEIDYRQYFAIEDTLSQKKICIIPDTDINKISSHLSESELSGKIYVFYRGNILSEIEFLTDSFLVDRYGNIDCIDKVLFSGQMGENRVGNMLPIDYEPRYPR